MAGLEKIIERIEQTSNSDCEAILAKANADAKKLVDEAVKKAEEKTALILQKADEQCALINEKAASSSDFSAKKIILTAKNEYLAKVISDALDEMNNMSDEKYLNAVKSLVKKYAESGEGVVCFNKKNLARIPDGFEKELNAVVSENSSIKISSEPNDIDEGFLLCYNDIEQNCTFKALVEESLDDIRDALYQQLFA